MRYFLASAITVALALPASQVFPKEAIACLPNCVCYGIYRICDRKQLREEKLYLTDEQAKQVEQFIKENEKIMKEAEENKESEENK